MKQQSIRWINSSLNDLKAEIDRLIPQVLAEQTITGEWIAAMPGGPLQLAWVLLAEIECIKEEDQPAFSINDCISSILLSYKDSQGFPATYGGPIDIGATRFILAVFRLVDYQAAHNLSPDLQTLLKKVLMSPTISKGKICSHLYYRLGGLLESLTPKDNSILLGFPLYATIGDLFSRHWTFGWFRRLLSEPSQILVPCIFAWLNKAAEQTWTVQFITFICRKIGWRIFERRRYSLADRITYFQSPNGSWAWTTLGTSMAIVALRFLGVPPNDLSIRKGIAYLRSLHYNDNGIVYQSWSRGSVWDTAISADALLAIDGKLLKDSKKIVNALRARLLFSGLTEFDLGIGLGDYDSTAVTLAFFAHLRNKGCFASYSIVEVTTERMLEALLEGQSKVGGWSFSTSNAHRRIKKSPLREIWNQIFDTPSPDITARILLALAATRQLKFLDIETRDRIDKAIACAISYLEAVQRSNGSWQGQWSDSDISVTAEVLVALFSIQADTSNEMISRGRSWLLHATKLTANLSSVEATWAAAGIIASSPSHSIWQDELAIAILPSLILQAVTDDLDTLRFAYPVVYPHERYAAPGFDRGRKLFALSFLWTAFRRGTRNARKEVLWGHSPFKRLNGGTVNGVELVKVFEAIRARALWLGGRPVDISQRIIAHLSVYFDSERNFTFPLLALHGAGWAYGYFRFLGSILGLYATMRHPLSSRKREEVIKRMQRAMDGFKFANRRVLADTFANYHFSKEYGQEPGAEKILGQPFLSQLNALHDSVRSGEILTASQKAKLYSDSFNWEQTNSVWPMVERAIRDVRDPIVTLIAFKPIVRFAYFPFLKFLFFSDFTKTEERILEGWKAYRLAEQVGWAQTERAIGRYQFLPANLIGRCDTLLRWSMDLAAIDKMPPDILDVS